MSAQAYAAISNFGRDVEISLAVVEYDGRNEIAHVGQPTDIVWGTSVLEENVAVESQPTLTLRHDVAQSLYEALYRLYGPQSVPSDPALREALTVERNRVDSVLRRFLKEE